MKITDLRTRSRFYLLQVERLPTHSSIQKKRTGKGKKKLRPT
jgi:hypothetical protein